MSLFNRTLPRILHQPIWYRMEFRFSIRDHLWSEVVRTDSVKSASGIQLVEGMAKAVKEVKVCAGKKHLTRNY